MVGVYSMDIYGEAASADEGYIDVDFLTGSTLGGSASLSLMNALKLYSEELPRFCERNGVEVAEFRRLSVRFLTKNLKPTCIVTIEDRHGRSSIDEYQGLPARRVKKLDYLGRVRRK
ncbi:hypothetical protein [Agrobacterium tumefaciens]|uniref:hypothetical protein n=1 Tax=Agrobacterium tumefaciens TaxID=358 RepID=UPI00157284F4|nr:hypothetical protein [Agrobacterium tumefaciens]NTE37536.1 hypothetical protein [Agrobacterium tumefaciens]NTE53045.1 hypothetical protein [Agrobacterium tumefaciens]